MKCMYAQTKPRFILSSEGVLGGMEFEPMSTPREKSFLFFNLRVPDQNGASQAGYVVEIYRSGPEPWTCSRG